MEFENIFLSPWTIYQKWDRNAEPTNCFNYTCILMYAKDLNGKIFVTTTN